VIDTGLVDNKGSNFEDSIRRFKIKSIQLNENEVKTNIFYEDKSFNEFIYKLSNSFCEKYNVETVTLEPKVSKILNKGKIKYFYLKAKGYKTVVSIFKNFLEGEIYKCNDKNIINMYTKESIKILQSFLDKNIVFIIDQLSRYYIDEYIKTESNKNLQIGSSGSGTESDNYFKIAALNYLYMLPSTMQLCEAMDENKILEILNSSSKNKYLESIKNLKEPLKYIKLGLTEMHVEYREIEDDNNPCVDEIIKFIENKLIPSTIEIDITGYCEEQI